MSKMTLPKITLCRMMFVLVACSTTATLSSAAEPVTPAKPPAAESGGARADEDRKDSADAKAAGTTRSAEAKAGKAQAGDDAKAADSKATAASEATEGEAEEEKATPKPGKGAASAADAKGSPQRFTPTEQVRADFDVSFPIDI